ncbi:MAG: MFS transporter [Microbacteriaceae bacterium]
MTSVEPRRFAALRVRGVRGYIVTSALSMMGDNVEHVITYWVLWQTFHSPALVGFQVISHWLPFLVLSVPFGALAERYDCRRLIQASQALFMLVSIVWGVLFVTGTLQLWLACVLLVLHGVAGSLWGPAEQLLLYEIVGRDQLPSAIRLGATFRSIGILFGPVVGSALLVGLGSTLGIFANVLLYLPLSLVLLRMRAGRGRSAVERGAAPGRPPGRIGPLDTVRALLRMRSSRTLMAMMIVAALTAVTIGGAIQPAMPQFAARFGFGDAGLGYGTLLFASGAGGVLGGLALEATGWLRASARTAIASTAVFGLVILVFAVTDRYWLALAALLIGGVANIASSSTGQSVVQLEAPPGERGAIVGAYGMFSSGARVFEGVLLGGLGAAIGTPATLAWLAAALVAGTLGVGTLGVGLRGAAAGAALPRRAEQPRPFPPSTKR